VKQELKKNRSQQNCFSNGFFKLQFEDFDFTASKSWQIDLKHNIQQKKITRYIKSKSALDTAMILQKAYKFQKRVAKKIAYFDKNYIINTDQTECEYRCEESPINKIRKNNKCFSVI